MDFTTAVRTCIAKYADFSGRARRSEYWFFYLFVVVVGSAGNGVDFLLGTDAGVGRGPVAGLVSLALLLPSLAVGVRRLHDTSRSGWWLLVWLVPVIGWIVLVVFFVQDSHGDNDHGPSPKSQPAAA